MHYVIIVLNGCRVRSVWLESAESVDRRWQERTMQKGFGERVELWQSENGSMTFIQVDSDV